MKTGLGETAAHLRRLSTVLRDSSKPGQPVVRAVTQRPCHMRALRCMQRLHQHDPRYAVTEVMFSSPRVTPCRRNTSSLELKFRALLSALTIVSSTPKVHKMLLRGGICGTVLPARLRKCAIMPAVLLTSRCAVDTSQCWRHLLRLMNLCALQP